MAEQFWADCFVDDLPNFEKVWDAAIANRVPDGFVVVPVEPTNEMIKAFHDRYWLPHHLTPNGPAVSPLIAAYRDLIAAAQPDKGKVE